MGGWGGFFPQQIFNSYFDLLYLIIIFEMEGSSEEDKNNIRVKKATGKTMKNKVNHYILITNTI